VSILLLCGYNRRLEDIIQLIKKRPAKDAFLFTCQAELVGAL